MALFEGSAGTMAVGAVVGFAAALLAPVLVPVVMTVGRPLLKGAIKGAIVAYGRGQEVVGELSETVEDLTVEAREEMRSGGQRGATAGGGRAQAQPQGAPGGGRHCLTGFPRRASRTARPNACGCAFHRGGATANILRVWSPACALVRPSPSCG